MREDVFSSDLSQIKQKQRNRFDAEAELRVSKSSYFRNFFAILPVSRNGIETAANFSITVIL